MLEERLLLAKGFVIEIFLFAGHAYRLSCRKGNDLLVEYENDGRKLNGRKSAYVFKSVEQLRYDFERDAENAQRQA